MQVDGWETVKPQPVIVPRGKLSLGVKAVSERVYNLSQTILGGAAQFLNRVHDVVFIPYEVQLIQDLQNLALLDPEHRKALEALEKCFEMESSDTSKIVVLEKYIETLGKTLKKLEERTSQGYEKTMGQLRNFLENALYQYTDTLKDVSFKKRGEVLSLLREVIEPHS